MGAADGVSDMCGSLFFYRAWGDLGDVLHRPEIYASRRCHGRVHHLDRDKKHGRSGPAKATLLIVVTQILVSYIAEVFGLFGVEKAAFEWRKLIGAALAIAGIVVFRW